MRGWVERGYFAVQTNLMLIREYKRVREREREREKDKCVCVYIERGRWQAQYYGGTNNSDTNINHHMKTLTNKGYS